MSSTTHQSNRLINPSRFFSSAVFSVLLTIITFLFFNTLSFDATASELKTKAVSQLSAQLSSNQYVLIMRHADAPGFSDPTGFNVKDCQSQRNLGEDGKKQAREIGQWLKARGITDARVLSSPWCRCMDTATLMNIGTVSSENALGSFFENRGDGREQTLALHKKIQQELITKNNKPLVLVTHQVNIQAFTGIGVGSGQMVLVQVNSRGQHVSHSLVKQD